MSTRLEKNTSTFWNRLLGRSDIIFGGATYMRRWRLIHTKWFGVRLHHIMRSDSDRELHDHPFTFLSIILRGGYTETTVDGREVWYGSVLLRGAEVLHRLALKMDVERSGIFDHNLVEHSTWTLVFRGPIRRRWGFLDVNGMWIDAMEFDRHQQAQRARASLGQIGDDVYNSIMQAQKKMPRCVRCGALYEEHPSDHGFIGDDE